MILPEQQTKIPLITNALHKEQEDYTQSANALFHFMNQIKFLENALVNKALIPRFCREDMSYLNLNIGGHLFNKIAILQKCFCDIPLHKVATDFELMLTEQSKDKLKSYREADLSIGNNHPRCYGKFAIAFSKRWCEERKLQPIHYLNENSPYSKQLEEIMKSSFSQDDLPDSVALDLFQRLALLKPLRGKMKKFIEHEDKKIEIEVVKNFHDEQEWRFIPNLNTIVRLNLVDNFCIWQDLLGFGQPFYESNWNIKSDLALNNLHRIALLKDNISDITDVFLESIFTLNDGFIRTYVIPNNNVHMMIDWLYNSIRKYKRISDLDIENGYYGLRGVMAYGQRAQYISSDTLGQGEFIQTTDDHKAEYNRKNIIYTPRELQMNTAFSKAYIIEASGSKMGVKGAKLYIDIEVIRTTTSSGGLIVAPYKGAETKDQ